MVYINEDISRYRIEKFLAVGGESIVFKAIKEDVNRTYALKFRTVDRWADFCEFELECYKELEQCSVSKIAGVITDISSEKFRTIYEMIPPTEIEKARKQGRNFDLNQNYFCVIEDYIPGQDLEVYCHELGHCPQKDAKYEDVLLYQKDVFNWIIQFSEIMMKVTEENGVLHLDIKPANIMLLPETKALTLVDFGASSKMKNNEVKISTDIYNGGCIGTMGFAAPEAYKPSNQSPPYSMDKSKAYVDERSDIFSFGATLWDCVTPNANKINMKNTEEGYYKRDLFNTPLGYSQELEDIIVKCTEKNPEDRFQSFAELHKTAVEAEKKLPSIYKKNRINIVFYFLSAITLLLAVFVGFTDSRSSELAYEIADVEFEEMKSSYNEFKIDQYQRKSIALVKADPSRADSYKRILEVAYNEHVGGDISKKAYDTISNKEVTEVFIPCLQVDETKVDSSILESYANTIIEKCEINDFQSLTKSIVTYFGEVSSCHGYVLAEAYQNYLSESEKSYKTLIKYEQDIVLSKEKKYSKAIEQLAKRIHENADVMKELKGIYNEEAEIKLTDILVRYGILNGTEMGQKRAVKTIMQYDKQGHSPEYEKMMYELAKYISEDQGQKYERERKLKSQSIVAAGYQSTELDSKLKEIIDSYEEEDG